MNMYYKLWSDENKQNDYVLLKCIGRSLGRDEKEETIRNTSPEQFQSEFEWDFRFYRHFNCQVK